MKRIIALLAMVSLAACGGDGETIYAPAVTSDGQVPGTFYRIQVDGKPCIAWIHRLDPDSNFQDSYSGLSCDWGSH